MWKYRQQNTRYPQKMAFFAKRIFLRYLDLCYVNLDYHKFKTFPLLQAVN